MEVPVRPADLNGVDAVVVEDDLSSTTAPETETKNTGKPRRSTRQLPIRPPSSHTEQHHPYISAAQSPALTPPTTISEEDKRSVEEVMFRQAKCDTVDLKIDSQRPMEEQFGEDDFLDEEVSGDEDWNGDVDADDFEDGGYAW